jgi:nitrate/TMAO reductase-like tetraheme cytochrome c subunit
MFVLLIIVVLIVVAILFGGFQKGTKSGSLSRLCTSCSVMPTLSLSRHVSGPG